MSVDLPQPRNIDYDPDAAPRPRAVPELSSYDISPGEAGDGEVNAPRFVGFRLAHDAKSCLLILANGTTKTCTLKRRYAQRYEITAGWPCVETGRIKLMVLFRPAADNDYDDEGRHIWPAAPFVFGHQNPGDVD